MIAKSHDIQKEMINFILLDPVSFIVHANIRQNWLKDLESLKSATFTIEFLKDRVQTAQLLGGTTYN